MLLYADRSETVEPARFFPELQEITREVRKLPTGLERHARLTELLIDAGRLLQGVADADFEAVRHDRRTAATEALSDYLMRLAEAVLRSTDPPDGPDVQFPTQRLSLREPEGYAFYAVYPEAYAVAAGNLRLRGPPCVIGIRSIGTSLGPIVAAALGAKTFVTVRPFGDAFARRVSVSRELQKQLLGGDFHYVIVDEGPGQSGSSFGAVVDWLLKRGASIERIAFIPSHGGEPGRQASEAHRAIWETAQRSPASFDNVWLADRFGPLEPVAQGSSPKFLGLCAGECVLLRFAGLGKIGRRKFEMARALAAAGWAPEPLHLAHGFLVERWHPDAQPLTASDRPLREIAEYIGARARLFPASAEEGASIEQLFEMLHRNTELALGEEAACRLAEWPSRLGSLAKRAKPVRTDNRMDPHKWLRPRDGRLLKSDALDHHRSHDLVGTQDIAWDAAGAVVEFDLHARETAWLAAEAGRAAGRLVDPELLQFMTLAYCAFRLGQAHLAGAEAVAARYRRALAKLLLQRTNHQEARESALDGMAKRTASGTNLPYPG